MAMPSCFCSTQFVLSCVALIILCAVAGPLVLGLFGGPELHKYIHEEKHGSLEYCTYKARDCNATCLDISGGYHYINGSYTNCIQIRVFVMRNLTLVELYLVYSFSDAYELPSSYKTILITNRADFNKKWLPDLAQSQATSDQKKCFSGAFYCHHLDYTPNIVYIHSESEETPMIAFTVGLVLCFIGWFPLTILAVIIIGERYCQRRMNAQGAGRVQQLLDSMAAENKKRKQKALSELDTKKQYSFGRFHNSTILDIAASDGDMESLEKLFKQPEVTVHGIQFFANYGSTKTRCAANFLSHESFGEYVRVKRIRTPLHYACIGYHLNAVQFLVERGANVNSQDTDGDTPFLAVLKEAVRANQDYEVMYELLRYLANVGTNMSKCGRFTPIYSACTIGNYKILLLILQCGSISTKIVKSFHKDTPLTILIKQNLILGVKMLIMGGYNLKADPIYASLLRRDTPIGQFITRYKETLPTLTQLCRKSIRKRLGTVKVMDKIQRLPLPVSLRAFLNLADIEEMLIEEQEKNSPTSVEIITDSDSDTYLVHIDGGELSNNKGMSLA